MFTFIENFIEALYLYQQSYYFILHLVLLFGIAVLIIYLLIEERNIIKREQDPPISKCAEKVDYFNYATTKAKNTQDALRKL
jgi:uncharacterized sodium:solute symporter family permease YidK